jgi:nucleotide-binding universal stress UspA family protein
MIPKISKILYATDLSLNAAYVFRYALSTAEKHDAKIDVLYAIEPAAVMGLGSKFGSPVVNVQAIVKKIKKRIEALADRERKDKASLMKHVSEIRVIEGDPAAVILQAVEDLKPDILIMGTHSKGMIAHTFLGSVAQKVLQRSRIPVYVIPIPDMPSDYVKWLNQQQRK